MPENFGLILKNVAVQTDLPLGFAACLNKNLAELAALIRLNGGSKLG